MKTFAIYAVSLINLFIALRTWYLLYKKRIQPSLAMWVFFFLAVCISLFTYLRNGHFSPQDNILNTADLVMTASIIVGIALLGDHTTRFNRFDLLCLGLVGLIVLFWVVTRNDVVSNLLIQLIMVIAYLPVYKRMYVTLKNSESYLVWISMLVASAIALYSTKGFLAGVYVWRAIVCILFMLGFMLWIDKGNKGK